MPSDTTNMTKFLEELTISSVPPEVVDDLDSPLTLDEVMQSIRSMQSGKPEFFKKCDAKLAPLLLAMYNESFGNGSLPPNLTQASIALLLKKDKDATLCSSYRP